jgi:hypothetical protein
VKPMFAGATCFSYGCAAMASTDSGDAIRIVG